MELQEIKIADADTEQNKTGSVESLRMFTNKGNCCVVFRQIIVNNTNR